MGTRSTPRRFGQRFPRSDRERPGATLLKAGAVLLLIGLGIYLASMAISGVPGRSYRTMYVEVPDKANITYHDAVRIGGVQVGQVMDVGNTRAGGARIELQLENDTRLARDTSAVIRANGLLGARYMQLIPGRSRQLLADDATIREGDESLTYGLPEVLDTFDGRTRIAMRSTIDALGEGFAGNGEPLNAAIPKSPVGQRALRRVTRAVLSRPGAAERLLPAMDSALGPLDDGRLDLAASFDPASQAIDPFVDERDAVRAMLDVAPSALTTARAGLGEGRRLLGATRELAVATTGTLPDAPPGLRSAAALLRDSPAPLRRATALLRAARPAVPAALRITSALRPVLGRLDGAFAQLSPMSRLVGAYGCDIVNAGVILRSMTGFGGTGNGPNGPAMQFRLQSVADLPSDKASLYKRETLPAPCKWLSREYPITRPPALGVRP